jgi:hypothetical protein
MSIIRIQKLSLTMTYDYINKLYIWFYCRDSVAVSVQRLVKPHGTGYDDIQKQDKLSMPIRVEGA